MHYRSLVLLGLLVGTVSAQPRSPADLGPGIGAQAPAFSGVDQFGRERTLDSLMGPNGIMLVFYRSADW